MKKVLLCVLAVIVLAVLVTGGIFYRKVMSPSVLLDGESTFSLYIPTGADFEQVKDSLYMNNVLSNPKGFEWWAALRKYPDHVKPGHYLLKRRMSIYELCQMLSGGMQTPVKVTFNNMRDIPMLAGRIAQQIEADSIDIVNYLNDSENLAALGFNRQTIPAMFLPNTYEFYWNTNAAQFVEK